MGWSCTAKAGLTLDGISKTFQGSSNTWNTEKGTFFFETGRENEDGAITGQVWKMIVWQSEDRIKRSGSFRIEPDGTIARFPHLPAWLKKSAVEYGAAEYSRLYWGPTKAELTEANGPVCENCGQWQRAGRNGYLDCLNDCAQRGFALKKDELKEADNMEIKIRSSWTKVSLWIFRSWGGERKLNGKPYHGPVFYLGTDNRVTK